MGVIGVAIDGAQAAAKKLQKLGADLLEAERRAVDRAANEMRSTFVRAASGEILKRRTGVYASSIGRGPVERGVNGSFEARVGVREGGASKYAEIHETGGVIRPKGKVLAIPVGNALTPAGVARFGPRDVPDGFWRKSKNGNLVFLAPKGAGGELEVLFVGKTSVTIPARAPMRKSFEEIRPRVPSIVQEEVARAVASA